VTCSRRSRIRGAAVAAGIALAFAHASACSGSEAAGEATEAPAAATVEKATFAGGCFWCMEPPFDALDGVLSTTAGYTGGEQRNPTYEQVSAGVTGHAEAIEIVYEPAKVSYERLLDVFWQNVDPTTPNRQFCDVGSQYRTAIFTHGNAQKAAAEASKKRLDASGRLGGAGVVTEIVAAGPFYPAEEYHQDYYVKNPLRYKYYRWGCGRDARLEELWGPEPEADH
jgi:peptide-methionine (S)-S-oxide reductase